MDLADLYPGMEKGEYTYGLRSMVCYYHGDYQGLGQPVGDPKWRKNGNCNISIAGPWNKVLADCASGRKQPSLLFYDQLEAEPPSPAASNERKLTRQAPCSGTSRPGSQSKRSAPHTSQKLGPQGHATRG
jgi:hypothetical protein